MSYELAFLKSLGLTIFIETLILLLLTKYFNNKQHYNVLLILFTGIIASFATLPYVWHILPVFIKDKFIYHFCAESFAWLTETFIFMGILRIPFKRALLFAFICNAVSYGIGLLIA